MASIKESFEDTLSEKFSYVFVILFAVPVYFLYMFFKSENFPMLTNVGIPTLYALLIFMICIYNNVRNSLNYTLPTFVQYISFAIKSLFCVIPLAALLAFAAFQIVKIEIPIPQAQTAYSIIVSSIFASIFIMSAMQFGKTGKIISAFNVIVISQYCIDILIRLIFMLLLLAIINGVVIGVIAYVFGLFFPLDHPIFIAICSIAFVMNLFAAAHYMAQIEYEVVPREEKEHII